MATWHLGSRPATDENASANISPAKQATAAVVSPSKTRAPLGSLTANVQTPQRTRAKSDQKISEANPLIRPADARAAPQPKKRKTTSTSRITASPPLRDSRIRVSSRALGQHSRPSTTHNSSIYTTPRTRLCSVESDSGRDSATSFTSLINYDPASSTVVAQGPFSKPFQTGHHQHQHLSTGPPSRSEVLKLVLQVAAYKLVTNQLYTPFSRLKIYRRRSNLSSSSSSLTVQYSHETPVRSVAQSVAAQSADRPMLESSASPLLPTGAALPRANSRRQGSTAVDVFDGRDAVIATPKSRIGTETQQSGTETAYRFSTVAPETKTPDTDFTVRSRAGIVSGLGSTRQGTGAVTKIGTSEREREYRSHVRKSSESTILA